MASLRFPVDCPPVDNVRPDLQPGGWSGRSGKVIKHSAFCLSLVSPKYMGMVRKAFVISGNETEGQIEVDVKDEEALCLAAVEAFER